PTNRFFIFFSELGWTAGRGRPGFPAGGRDRAKFYPPTEYPNLPLAAQESRSPLRSPPPSAPPCPSSPGARMPFSTRHFLAVLRGFPRAATVCSRSFSLDLIAARRHTRAQSE